MTVCLYVHRLVCLYVHRLILNFAGHLILSFRVCCPLALLVCVCVCPDVFLSARLRAFSRTRANSLVLAETRVRIVGRK